jgi:hypothetical protein
VVKKISSLPYIKVGEIGTCVPAELKLDTHLLQKDKGKTNQQKNSNQRKTKLE